MNYINKQIGTNRMKRVIIFTLFSVILFIFQASLYAEDVSGLNTYLRKSAKIFCTNLEKDVPLNIYYKEKNTGSGEAVVIVYVINHGGERIGTDSDPSILNDLINQKYIVTKRD